MGNGLKISGQRSRNRLNLRLLFFRLRADTWNLLTDDSRATRFLIILLIVKVAMSVALYGIGFAGVSADEYSRSISEMKWAGDPYLVLGKLSWLPFHLYLNGSLLYFVPEPLWVPRVTAFTASCILFVYFFKLVRKIFSSHFIAATSSIGLVVYHWYVGLSATPMLDIYYLAAVVAGLYYAERWVAELDKTSLYLSAFSFSLASGFHYQAWMLIAIIDILSLLVVVTIIKRKEWLHMSHQLCAYFIVHAYIFFTMITTFLDVGNPLAFLGSHTDYSKWFYGGYTVSWASKFLYYPKMLLTNANPIFGILAIIGVFFALTANRDRAQNLVPLIAGLLVLGTYSIFNVFSVPPTAAPGRYSLVFYLFFLPYAGIALSRIASLNSDAISTQSNRSRESIAISLLLVGILWAGVQIRYDLPFNRGYNDAIQAGREIAKLMGQEAEGAGYLLELDFWEYLPAKLTAGYFSSQYLDRHFDVRQRNLPSLLKEDPELFANMLNKKRIVAMAFRTPELVSLAGSYGEMVSHCGDWQVFKVNNKRSE
jgi:hypothetical protein